MRKVLLILTMLCLGAVSAGAVEKQVREEPKVQFTVEWGATATVLNFRDYNYLDAEGSRIADDWTHLKYYFNAELLAGAEFNLGRKFALGLYSGYIGVEDNIRLIPALLRATWMPAGCCSDGVFLYGEGGIGLRDIDLSHVISLASLGTGYRWALSRRYSLDLGFSVRAALDHPDLGATAITSDSAIYGAASFSLGINF